MSVQPALPPDLPVAPQPDDPGQGGPLPTPQPVDDPALPGDDMPIRDPGRPAVPQHV